MLWLFLYLVACKGYDTPAHQVSSQGWYGSIVQSHWGCGLGRFLMQLAVEQAHALGFEQLELGVYSDNPRAIHLYDGVLPHAFKLKDGTYRDEILMVKTL